MPRNIFLQEELLNNLPQQVVCAASVDDFKKLIDHSIHLTLCIYQTSQLSRFHRETQVFGPLLKVSRSGANFSRSRSGYQEFSRFSPVNKTQTHS